MGAPSDRESRRPGAPATRARRDGRRRLKPRRTERRLAAGAPEQDGRRQRLGQARAAARRDGRGLANGPDHALHCSVVDFIRPGTVSVAGRQPTAQPVGSGRREGAPQRRRAARKARTSSRRSASEHEGTCGRAKSSDDRTEQDFSRRRMPEQRANQVTMVIELRGLPDDRHDAVGQRQLEEASISRSLSCATDRAAALRRTLRRAGRASALVRRQRRRIERSLASAAAATSAASAALRTL